MEPPVAFREVLAVRERVFVHDEDGRLVERALAECGAHRRVVAEARAEVEVFVARDHVDRVRVYETAVVVANVDHDARLRAILHVEVGEELLQSGLPHVGDVDVAEASAADALDVRAPSRNPRAIAQPRFVARVDRQHRERTRGRGVAGRRHADLRAFADRLRERGVHVGVRVDVSAVHREQLVAGPDAAGERERAEREHVREP